MNETPNPTPSAVSAEAREAAERELQRFLGALPNGGTHGKHVQSAIDSARAADRATIERLQLCVDAKVNELAGTQAFVSQYKEARETITRLESELDDCRKTWSVRYDSVTKAYAALESELAAIRKTDHELNAADELIKAEREIERLEGGLAAVTKELEAIKNTQ